ncbi:MAG: mechanosensitive ion channel [Woeseiaceae bacterium]|nr:mechanosensitive ion channel [Woeseiaceae bacterium]NIP19555.1 mechanosensitive ion channel [Woeseiaceae bacterium]NIS88509.1 mechanosensitive ion channel [Woeseiaceae bacterium]
MRIAPRFRLLPILLSLLVAPHLFAQETEQLDEPALPELSSLETNWWEYFQGSREDVEARITVFLERASDQVGNLSAENQDVAQAVLDSVRNNLAALVNLLDEAEPTVQALSPEAAGYSIEDLLRFAAMAREATAAVGEDQVEVNREQRVLDGATRRRDAVFKEYVDAEDGDERWLAALRLVQTRSAQAISARRLQLLTNRLERHTEYADAVAERVQLATDRLQATADEDDLSELDERVANGLVDLEAAEARLRAAQLAASELDEDTPEGRSQQRLEQQRLIDAELDLALAQISLAQDQAHLAWSQLVLDADPDTGVLRDRSLEWTELVRSIVQRAPDWERETQDELIAAQGVSRQGLDRAAQRVLDQRVGTAQGTLAQAGQLKAAVADLELLVAVVDIAAAEYEGPFWSWLGGINRNIKSAFSRVASLGDVTLFSIGETPVTGDDVLRVLLILLVAALLSRGIRHAISGVGEDESSGTQASLYTVGRLTHYAIIIIALFVALSSIGLDFGSVALVAGALSVGIGFGLQSIVNNFVSGLIILFEHSLRVGDYIELDNGLTGTVKAVNVRSTLINTNDNIDIVVPNSEFVSARLTNWTLNEGTRRVRVPFGVAYGSDKELVRKAALEAAGEVPYTLANRKGRETDVWLTEFGDSSLNFLLLVWVNRQGARRPTRCRSAYLWALETKLNKYGIEIPFPQRDLHVKSGWPKSR